MNALEKIYYSTYSVKIFSFFIYNLAERKSFVFETVMSASNNIYFIAKAKKNGFFIRLFFISTENPKINASRIADRGTKGGHDVPITKFISRYYKSIENCKVVSSIVDRLYVYDNSVDGEKQRYNSI